MYLNLINCFSCFYKKSILESVVLAEGQVMSLLKDYLTVFKEDSKGKCKAFKGIENVLKKCIKCIKIYFRDEASGFFLLIFPSQSISHP